MIVYTNSGEDLEEKSVVGLFGHWGKAPAPANMLRILRGSDHVVLAVDDENGDVVGYITAITDGVSAAFIPHLEVRAEWQGRGIGSELVRHMLAALRHLYVIDLICDKDLEPFYARHGFRPWTGMIIRNYNRQACN